MTKDEMKDLYPGDLIRHKQDRSKQYVVTGTYGDRVTAVRSVDLTNPIEWEKVSKSS